MKSVDLVISTYNNPCAILQILSFINKGSHLDLSVHIADDGSSQKAVNLITENIQHYSYPVFHHWHENEGFRKAKILNTAINKCDSKYVVFLDGDCLPHKHFVKDHLSLSEKGYFVQGRRCFIKESHVDQMLSGKTSLLSLMIRGKVSGLLKSIRLPKPIIKKNYDMYGLLGCNLAIWRDDLTSINGFDEDYEGWGREDSDLGARLYNLGLKRKLVYGRGLVYHLNHPVNKRDQLAQNDKRLSATISSGKIRCTNGLVKE